MPALDERADDLAPEDVDGDLDDLDDDAELTDPEPLRAMHLTVGGDGGVGLLAAWDEAVAGRERARAVAPVPEPGDQTLQLRPPAPRPRHKRVWAALRRALTSAFEPWQASAL